MNIAQDTVRVGEKVRSPWHDGFDTKMYHQRCGIGLGRGVHEFKGLQRLRWTDQLSIAERFVPGVSSAPPSAEMKRVRRLNEMVWEVRDRLGKVKKDALKELIELNDVFVSEKAKPDSMLHGIADGLVNGRLPACPWCHGRSLELEGTMLRCYGYMNGATHCQYKSCVPPAEGSPHLFGSPCTPDLTDPALLKRDAPWQLTEAVRRALKEWSPPADAPVRALDGGGGPAGSSATPAPGAANGGKKGKKRAPSAQGGGGGGGSGGVGGGGDVSEEEVVAEEDVMVGMSFASIGSVRPAAAELQALVESRGGRWVSGDIGDGSAITHLVASEAEARKPAAKRSVKYTAALEGGVPIVPPAFVLALTGIAPAEDTAEEAEVAEGTAGASGAKENEDNGGKRGRDGAASAPIDVDAFDAAPVVDVDEEGGEGEEEEQDLSKLKVAELKARLEAAGLPTAGKKPELVVRLNELRATQRAAAEAKLARAKAKGTPTAATAPPAAAGKRKRGASSLSCLPEDFRAESR